MKAIERAVCGSLCLWTAARDYQLQGAATGSRADYEGWLVVEVASGRRVVATYEGQITFVKEFMDFLT